MWIAVCCMRLNFISIKEERMDLSRAKELAFAISDNSRLTRITYAQALHDDHVQDLQVRPGRGWCAGHCRRAEHDAEPAHDQVAVASTR